MKVTIFGASGFIGKNLVKHFEKKGYDVFIPDRSGDNAVGKELGHVIYAIGLAGDFRSRPFDTVDSHVCKLAQLMKSTHFDSWLYLSSARIYGHFPSNTTTNEEADIPITMSADSIYDISKLMGEALCLAQKNKKIRVVRLSNVYGIDQSKHTFLGSIIDDLHNNNKVLIHESADSMKDYISILDVQEYIEKIAINGQHKIYNLASGRSTAHKEIAKKLTETRDVSIDFSDNSNTRKFPSIDVPRIESEFGLTAHYLIDDLPDLLLQNKSRKTS